MTPMTDRTAGSADVRQRHRPPDGMPEGFRRDGATVIADCDGPVLSASVVADGVARIRFAADGVLPPHRSWSPVPPDEAFPAPAGTVLPEDDGVLLRAGRLLVRIARGAAGVSVTDRETGQSLLRAADAPAHDPGTGAASWVVRLPADLACHGLGEGTGELQRRGRRHTFW